MNNKAIIMKKIFLLGAVMMMAVSACEKVETNRIPPLPVYLNFGNQGLWNTYGVSGYGDYAFFSKTDNIPVNYSYKANDYTGFGGVLLIEGINGPVAYDRACPVEAKKNVVLKINAKYEAECPQCGSRFNVCDAAGAPIAGPALDNRYGLEPINVIPSGGGYIISR